ncbi:MAG: hypothetical protein WEB78_02445, partial [Ilumatobacteraceae bacterium]
SITSPTSLEAAKDAIAAFRTSASGVMVVVGGRAVQSVEHGRELGAHDVASSAQGFVALLEGIRADTDGGAPASPGASAVASS